MMGRVVGSSPEGRSHRNATMRSAASAPLAPSRIPQTAATAAVRRDVGDLNGGSFRDANPPVGIERRKPHEESRSSPASSNKGSVKRECCCHFATQRRWSRLPTRCGGWAKVERVAVHPANFSVRDSTALAPSGVPSPRETGSAVRDDGWTVLSPAQQPRAEHGAGEGGEGNGAAVPERDERQ